MISEKNIIRFEKIIGYSFRNKQLLSNCLIHPSYLTDNKNKSQDIANDFERLEFLGDRVLGLAVSSIIYKKFTKNNEGDLSKKLSYLVQKDFLYKISIKINIDKFLKYSFKKNEKMNISILADSIESLIGAIYIDGGFINAKKFIRKIWGPYFELKDTNMQDPKTKLQEISQKETKKLPDYKLINKKGPSHSPVFTISLKVMSLKKINSSGTSIREAEKNAAYIALKLLDDK